MKIVFFGTSVFAVPGLERLSKPHEIAAVVTRPDKPKGRDLRSSPSPVKAKALSLGLDVISIDDMDAVDAEAALKKYGADLFVVVSYGKILPAGILSLPKAYPIGLHASLLPQYRGASPINWALLNGDKKTGVTVFKLSSKMDAGEIIMKEEVDIRPPDNAETLSLKLSETGAGLLVKAVDAIAGGKAQLTKQDGSKATFTAKIRKEDGKIDWAKPAAGILNKVRAFYGWPGTFSRLNGRIVKIWEAELAQLPEEGVSAPGQVAGVDGKGIVVACGDGAIRITGLQAEGGKHMRAQAYILGNKVRIGDKFVN